MKKFYNLALILALPVIFLFFTSEVMYPTGSPGGRTGSPGDNGANCTDCHTGNAPINKEGWILSPLMQFMGYSPGQSYSIIVAGYDENAEIYGFEMTAEDDSGNKVGTFEADVTGFTQLLSNTSITHTLLGTTPLTDSAFWFVTWTAPSTTVGDITFYAAVNAANGNGSTSGDQIYLTNMTASPSTGISNRQGQQSLGVYPNPSDGFISFEAQNADAGHQLEILNLTGQAVYTAPITVGKNNIDLSHLDGGIYIARVGMKSQQIIVR